MNKKKTAVSGAPSRQADKFVVRLPDGLRERIFGTAEITGRSMNTEVVTAVEWWLDKQALMNQSLQAMQAELQRLQLQPTPQSAPPRVQVEAVVKEPGNEQRQLLAALDRIAARWPATTATIRLLKLQVGR